MSSTLLIVDADGVTFRKKSSNKKKSNKSSKSLFGKIYKKFQRGEINLPRLLRFFAKIFYRNFYLPVSPTLKALDNLGDEYKVIIFTNATETVVEYIYEVFDKLNLKKINRVLDSCMTKTLKPDMSGLKKWLDGDDEYSQILFFDDKKENINSFRKTFKNTNAKGYLIENENLLEVLEDLKILKSEV